MTLSEQWVHVDFSTLQYGNPFDDYASRLMPRTLKDSFNMGEKLWLRVGPYRSALKRLIRYFITNIEFKHESIEVQERWSKLCNKLLDLQNILGLIGDDTFAYGNSITSLHAPFIRELHCPKCHTSYSAKEFQHFKFHEGEFGGKCGKCDYSGKFERTDYRDANPKNIHVIRWDPHGIDLRSDLITGYTEYWWTPQRHIVQGVQANDPFYLARLPVEILTVCESGQKLLLNPKTCFHAKMESLAGINAVNVGWGIPPVLSVFGQAFYVQMLRRFNEAVALNYLFPLRILTPPPTGRAPQSGQDPIHNVVGGSQFMTKINQMLIDHRIHPTRYYTLPYPVQEGTIGGQGTDMLRPDLITEGIATLLNEVGVPVEFYQGSLDIQAAPIALRQLEKNWDFLVTAMNNWIGWAVETIALISCQEAVEATLAPSTMIDDLMRKQILLQLAFQGDIAMQTALKPLNIDIKTELEKMRQEEEMKFDKQQELQRVMARRQGAQAGQAPQGMVAGQQPVGMPPGQAPIAPSLSDLQAQAQQYAQQLMSTPDPQRTSALISLKRSNPTLHALVGQMMEDQRQQSNSQGGAQMRQQTFGAS